MELRNLISISSAFGGDLVNGLLPVGEISLFYFYLFTWNGGGVSVGGVSFVFFLGADKKKKENRERRLFFFLFFLSYFAETPAR